MAITPQILRPMPEGWPGPFQLNGKLALVTGGGSGIGLGIATALVSAGARVIITGRREEQLRTACRQIDEYVARFADSRFESETSWHVHDVTDTGGAQSLASDIAKHEGHVTILVNNAGIHLKKRAAEITDEELAGVWATHVAGAFALSRAFCPGMIEKGGGSILFTSSMAALFGIPLVAAYSTAKTALTGLVRSLAVEWAEHGIRVNAIAPGWIASEMSQRALQGDPERLEKILSRTPLKAFGDPSDIGLAAVYLCSPAARFVTGVVLPVDGGASIGF